MRILTIQGPIIEDKISAMWTTKGILFGGAHAWATAESFMSGSLISSSSLRRPVKTTESVSMGLNLIRAEGTSSSSSKVVALSPAAGKCGITRRLITTGCNRSNSKHGSFSAELTNWKLKKIKKTKYKPLETCIEVMIEMQNSFQQINQTVHLGVGSVCEMVKSRD